MPEIDDATMAQNFGFALAVLLSDTELDALFRQAVAETWTADRFTAAVRNTAWYKTHSESWRNTEILAATDPASYQADLGAMATRLQILAADMGANVGGGVLAELTRQVYAFGYDDNQIRQVLSRYVQYVDGRFWGRAGQMEQELRKRAADQGVLISDETVAEWVGRSLGGEVSFEDALRKVDAWAASAYPHLSDRLLNGETLKSISDPYRQTMAALLELNPEGVTMQDPTIKQALASWSPQGGVQMQTLYDFENTIRKDRRWLGTKNAQDSGMQVARRVLNDMGLVA